MDSGAPQALNLVDLEDIRMAPALHLEH